MKLAKLLYFIAIIVMAIISFIMISHGWFLGYLIAAVAFAGVINYFDIVENNRPSKNKSYKSRRAAYFFDSIPDDEKQAYYDMIEKELQDALKK